MSTPRLPVYKPEHDLDPTKRMYDQKRGAGICVRSGCHALAVPGKSMCERHRERARLAAIAQKAKKQAQAANASG